MSKQKDREEFIAIMTQEGMPLPTIRALMRASATLQRLNEAECNVEQINPRHLNDGDGKAFCGDTSSRVVRMASAVTCWTCRGVLVERRVAKMLAGTPFVANFQGDPRGAAIKVKVPSGRTNDWGNEGICVP